MTRFWEDRLGAWIVPLQVGDAYVTSEPEVISTVLGSCVATCLRDTARPCGGMNHFLLPQAPCGQEPSPRYGIQALQLLLARVLAHGRRADLEVKMFGGARVIEHSYDVGRANVELVREFFAHERIPIVAEDVGERVARRIWYWPLTGRVQVHQLHGHAEAR